MAVLLAVVFLAYIAKTATCVMNKNIIQSRLNQANTNNQNTLMSQGIHKFSDDVNVFFDVNC
jgi:hypothetical protein